MTLKDDLSQKYDYSEKLRLSLERKGRDPDVEFALLLQIIDELQQIKGKL